MTKHKKENQNVKNQYEIIKQKVNKTLLLSISVTYFTKSRLRVLNIEYEKCSKSICKKKQYHPRV